MNPYIIVAFFTRDTDYEIEVRSLIKSLNDLKLTYIIYSVPDTQKWCVNAQQKGKVILHALKTNPKYNIVYVDADAIIQQNPKLFGEITEDFACHFKGGSELLSGTLFFKNEPKVHAFVERWITENTIHPQVWDQRNLDIILKASTDISVHDLPPQYTQIFDTMKQHGKAVIEHFQASRRLKQKIHAGRK